MKSINISTPKRFRLPRKAVISAMLLAAATILTAAGCAAPEAPAPTPVVLPTAEPELQPAAGGELILPMPRNPFKTAEETPMTPLTVNTEEMKNLYSLVYDQVLRCDVNNRISPNLAEKWTVDETGSVWTFQLRENVLWHDGEGLLTADDIVYTIGLIRSYGAESYYFPALDAYVNTVEKVDDRTVRISMKKPGMASLYALLFPVLRDGDSADSLVGTGPYQLVYSTETAVELTANARWWRQAAYITTVRFLARDSNDVALDSYEAGLLNMVPTTNVSAGKHREEGVTNVLDVNTQDCEVLLVNHSNSQLRNLQVRQAVAHAIDRSALVSNVYMNKAAICDVPVPIDSFLYDATTKIYDYDTAKSAALLAEAGWTEKNEEGIMEQNGRPLRLTLLVNDSTENTYRKSAATMLAAQLQQVGIEVVVETEKLGIGETESDFENRLKSGQFDLAMMGFNLERNGSLEQYLKRGGARNYGGYSNEMMELLMERAFTAVEEKDMREAHAALQQAFIQELPFITLGFRMSSLVYSAQIQNVNEIRGADMVRSAYRWYINTATAQEQA